MKKTIKRKNIFYVVISVFIVFLVGFAYFLSIIMNSAINSKWPYLDNGFQEGMIESSSNVVADKSFNELVMNGGNFYANFTDQYYTPSTKIGYMVPTTLNDVNQYQSLQAAAFDNGSQFIAAAGFNFLDSILGSTVYTDTGAYRANNGTIFKDKYKNKQFLLIDDSSHASSISRNTISIRFESEYAGFAAGIAASIYATANQTYRVSAYGGMQFQSVFDYLSGYEQAVNWFNYEVLGYDLYGNKTNEEAYLFNSSIYGEEPVHLINGYSISDSSITSNSLFIDYSNPTSQSSSNLWYTNSFNIGDATSISAKQLDAGSSVIFPVAGGQLIDTINQIIIFNQSSTYDAMSIGIDADATKQYPNFSDYILGSATKNVQVGTFIGMWYIDEFINKYNFVLPENPRNFELALEFMVSNTPDSSAIFEINGNDYEVHGWMENDPSFSSRDYATMTDEEVIDNYTNHKDPSIAYSNNLPYEQYGEQYPTSQINGAQYGSEFVATFDNGGLNFTTSSFLISSFEALRDDYVDLSGNTIVETWNFNDFLDLAFSQNDLIEKYSNTFSSPGLTPITFGLHDEYPWIPDWSIYSK